MSDVIEQGPTRWARPSDYGGPIKPGKRNANPPPGRYRPDPGRGKPARAPWKQPGGAPKPKPGQPGYVPRAPKIPLPKPGNGRPVPFPFRNPMRPARGAGFGRALGGVGLGIGIVNIIDDIFKLPAPVPNPGNGWYLSNGPCYVDVPGPYTSMHRHNTVGPCIRGQAGVALHVGIDAIGPPLPVHTSWSLWDWQGNTSVVRYAHKVSYRRDSAAVNLAPGLITHSWVPVGPNPNLQRATPTPRPVGVATPLPLPDPWADPASDGAGSSGNGASSPGKGIEITPDGVRPIPPRLKTPPRPREREGKVMTNSRRLLVGLFHILDQMSETAEVVDALYQALPDPVRKRWDCNRKQFPIDVAGQYGIDNADCKAKALWHNFQSVDNVAAIENIIKNYIEDKILGAIHNNLPGNVGSALDEQFRGISKEIDKVLDKYVDLGWIPLQ